MSDDRERARPEDVFSQRAEFYAQSKIHDDKETLSWLVELAMPRKDMIALDVGTGTGHTAMALAPHLKEVDAIDLTEAMMVEGRKLCAQRGIVNVHFMLGDAMRIPFPNEHFNIVTCRRAAHHFGDIKKALVEMARVLRPGGRMVIDDRSIPEDDELDTTINRLDALHDPSHVRDYRPSEWMQFSRIAGLEIEAMRMYRKHIPLTHFTDKVTPATAKEMKQVAEEMSERAKKVVNYEMADGNIVMDNFFSILVAGKRSVN